MTNIYPYKLQRFLLFIFVVLFFSACGYFLILEALQNDVPLQLRVYRVIHFDFTTEEADIFYAVLAAFSLGFAFLASYIIFLNLTLKRSIIIKKYSIICFANPFSKSEREVFYKDIQGIEKTITTGKVSAITIYNTGGKIALNSAFLKKEHMDEIFYILEQKVKALSYL